MRSFITSTLLVALAASLPISEASAQMVTLGVKGGATFATVTDTDGEFNDVGRRGGSAFGAFLQLGGRPVGFRAEVLLVQKGFEGSDDGEVVQFDVDYVEIPALLVVGLGAGGVRPSIYGGAAVGFERSCTISTSGAGLSATGDCDADPFDVETESIDVGAVIGAEVAFDVGGVNLVVDGRYTAGLTTVDASDDPAEIKNRAFMLMAGLAIPIG